MNKDLMEKIIDKDKALKKAKRSNNIDDWKFAKNSKKRNG